HAHRARLSFDDRHVRASRPSRLQVADAFDRLSGLRELNAIDIQQAPAFREFRGVVRPVPGRRCGDEVPKEQADVRPNEDEARLALVVRRYEAAAEEFLAL